MRRKIRLITKMGGINPALSRERAVRRTDFSNEKSGLNKIIEKYPPFYQRVWFVTSSIPFGQTRTYKWVAKKIGNPKAYRAVGQALAKNPYPGYIPCHRVIRTNGSLGGYSGKGGIDTKARLIVYEKGSVDST